MLVITTIWSPHYWQREFNSTEISADRCCKCHRKATVGLKRDSGEGSMWLNFLTSRMSTKVGIPGLHITFDRHGMTE